MPKKINYELLLCESAMNDYKLQQKLVKAFRGSKFLTRDGQLMFDMIKKCIEDYRAFEYDNAMEIATTMTDNAKDNTEYINAVANLSLGTIGAKDFNKYLEIVKNKIKEENLKRILQSVNVDIKDGKIDEAIRKLNLEEIKKEMSQGKENTREEKIIDFMLSLEKDYSPDGDNGVVTGITSIDDAIGKLKNGELFVLGGSSGAGKSLISTNMFCKWILEGKNVIYLSLEMGFSNVFARIASIIQGTNPKFYRGTFTSQDAIIKESELNQKFVTQINALNNWDIVSIADLPEGRATVENVLTKCKLIQKERGWEKIDCIILDYLQFLEKSNYTMTEFEAMKNNVNKIKAFVVTEDVPFILISSLNANGELKGATDILYTSDFSATINTDIRNKNIKHLEIIKSRYGSFGKSKMQYDDHLRIIETPEN